MRGIRSRYAIKKIVAGLALFYCGCNQSKSLHICRGKDTTKNGKLKTESEKLQKIICNTLRCNKGLCIQTTPTGISNLKMVADIFPL